LVTRYCGRLPPGRRGLKQCAHADDLGIDQSPSSRKAWIETTRPTPLKCSLSRLPPGRRGLKRAIADDVPETAASPSSRKAWIETSRHRSIDQKVHRRLPPGRRGLKHRERRGGSGNPGVSPSSRKAWIETSFETGATSNDGSRLPPGRRGLKQEFAEHRIVATHVAFLPEGVD